MPNTEGAIKSLSIVEYQKAAEAGVKLYSKLMHERLNVPVSNDDLLYQVHLQCHQDAVKFFIEKAILDAGDVKLGELNVSNLMFITGYTSH